MAEGLPLTRTTIFPSQSFAAATAGRICIVEVERLVATGELAPDDIHLPGIYVHRIVVNSQPQKLIEKRTIRDRK